MIIIKYELNYIKIYKKKVFNAVKIIDKNRNESNGKNETKNNLMRNVCDGQNLFSMSEESERYIFVYENFF